MVIVRKSPFTGKVRRMDLPITEEQINDWQSGTPIQRAFPNLTAAQREFIMTGITSDEWEETYGDH